jgi:hypothetical protein
VWRPEEKTPLVRPRRGWEDNIKMDVQEVGWGGMKWIYLIQNRDKVAGCCECGNEPSGYINCGEVLH